ELAIVPCGPSAQVGPFHCLHEPPAAAETLTLCGHIHPVAILHDANRSARLPCFFLHRNVLTLPAFGAFTGGAPIRPRPGDGVWVIAGEQVLQIMA
ncbi:MAG: ligase-associated DNA damage response endonuclease PdeM, partial [Caldilineaceae bacterium]